MRWRDEMARMDDRSGAGMIAKIKRERWLRRDRRRCCRRTCGEVVKKVTESLESCGKFGLRLFSYKKYME